MEKGFSRGLCEEVIFKLHMQESRTGAYIQYGSLFFSSNLYPWLGGTAHGVLRDNDENRIMGAIITVCVGRSWSFFLHKERGFLFINKVAAYCLSM